MAFTDASALLVPVNNHTDEINLSSFKQAEDTTAWTLDSVIFPKYKNKLENFFVEAIETETGPKFQMPNSSETFMSYYKKKYNQKKENKKED